ncbi:hypothetical protein Ancab_021580, partial [Ancistrocladus abbreviatus]
MFAKVSGLSDGNRGGNSRGGQGAPDSGGRDCTAEGCGGGKLCGMRKQEREA